MAPKVQNLVVVEKVDPVNLKYKLPLAKSIEPDKMRALSSIPPRVILIKDICAFIHCKIEEICQADIDTSYRSVCDNGKLKDEHVLLKTKGLMHALHILNVFKTEWMIIVLSRVHDQFMWLDQPAKITKEIDTPKELFCCH